LNPVTTILHTLNKYFILWTLIIIFPKHNVTVWYDIKIFSYEDCALDMMGTKVSSLPSSCHVNYL
jgi:hypothetical protein